MHVDGQLIEFRTQNHRSLRDEQTLSFVATGDDAPGLIRPSGLAEALLPVAAIYGGNASGKSNALDALAFMGSVVTASQRLWQPDDKIPRQPYRMAADMNAPSLFVAQFMVGGVRHEYGFALTDDEVVEEWLNAWPSGRRQEWYSRDKNSFEFGRNLAGENRAIEALTRPNSLFLSAAAQNNHAQLTSVYQWFSRRLRFLPLAGSGWLNRSLAIESSWWALFEDVPLSNVAGVALLRRQVRSLLSSSDLGIRDFMVRDDDVWGRLDPELRRLRISFAHESKAGSNPVWFDLTQESTGTQVLVSILPQLLQVLAEGGVLVLDEMSSLHPKLAVAIVQLFQDPAQNPRGAQLLFNTHDSTLLGNLVTDPPPLRRDQVWLTEKDRDGATHLYPLTDFRPRPTENLQRGYLQGRYGAIPFIGSLGVVTTGDET